MLSTPLKEVRKVKLLFDLGLRIFDAKNIDIAFTENRDSPFVEIILLAFQQLI